MLLAQHVWCGTLFGTLIEYIFTFMSSRTWSAVKLGVDWVLRFVLYRKREE